MFLRAMNGGIMNENSDVYGIERTIHFKFESELETIKGFVNKVHLCYCTKIEVNISEIKIDWIWSNPRYELSFLNKRESRPAVV